MSRPIPFRRAVLVVALASVAALAMPAAASTALPIVFEAAEGAHGNPTSYVARAPGHALLVGATGAQLLLDGELPVVVRSSLVGANPSARLRGGDPVPGGTSRFVGRDPSRWVRAAATMHRVVSEGVYPGIDMAWHGRSGSLEYDFLVAPGSDPSPIAIAIAGASISAIDADGSLVLDAGGHRLLWKKPMSWQVIDGKRIPVESAFRRIADDQVGFQLGTYDHAHQLIIDPVLGYSTYMAGTTFAVGDGLQNHGLAVALDKDGNAYLTGVVQSASFPVTGGAFETVRPGNNDAFVAKLSPDGTSLVWATYLGGTDVECYDNRHAAIAVAPDGAVVVTGSTRSADFPVTDGAWDTTLGGTTDVFVTRLSPDGASLEWSTYLGGTGIERGTGIVLDGEERPIVVGDTNDDFPTTPGAFQTLSDNLSAFATKLQADGSGLAWSTVLGRNSGAARDVAIDGQGNLYLTGVAAPPGGPGTGYPTTEGAYKTTVSGSFDTFVTKLAPDGSSLAWSTFLGGSANEEGTSIGVHSDGVVTVFGATNSTDFPATAGAFQSSLQSASLADAFVARVAANGASLLSATYLGGASLEDPVDMAVDAAGNALVTGATYSTNFPTTEDALQADMSPGPAFISAFVARVSTSGGLDYSTLFHPVLAGSTSIGHAIALDGLGGAVLTGTASSGLPTTTGSFQEEISFGRGGPFVARIDEIAEAGAAVLCGDSNGDGKVTTGDALAALKTAVGSGTCSPSACDFNGDGKITTADALFILRVAVGQALVPKCPGS